MLAYETDLLEYPDLFEGSKVMDGLVAELLEGARAEMAIVDEHGGAVAAVDYMKSALVDSHRERIRRIEAGEQVIVGVNRYTEAERSPLLEGGDGGILTVDPAVEAQQREAVVALARRARPGAPSTRRWPTLREVAAGDGNIMEATLAAARAGATTGEWSGALREAFGEFRAPTGVGEAAAGPADSAALEELREEVDRVSESLGRRLKILVGKPGLDGHSNGAEQIAVRARDIGMDVVYEGIRLTPSQIAASALQEGVHVVGLSILSGSHRELDPHRGADAARARRRRARRRGRDHPRGRRRAAAGGRRRGGLHAQGLRPDADHARHRGPGGGAPREPRCVGVTATAPSSARGCATATSPRRPPCSTSSRPRDAHEQVAALLREVSPAALGGEARAHVVGVTGPPGAGKSTLLGELVRAWRAGGRSVAVLAVDPSSRRSGGALLGDRARIPFDPGRRAASSSARPPRPGASAGSRPRRARPRTRWRPPSTSSWWRRSASARARPTSPRWPTPSPSSSSPARATSCSS